MSTGGTFSSSFLIAAVTEGYLSTERQTERAPGRTPAQRSCRINPGQALGEA
jgi:hypothetical protein